MSDLEAPSSANRPKLWSYYRNRNLKQVEVAAVFRRSREWVRKITLPFDDPNRITPSKADIKIAFDWSGGEIGPGDWYPPMLDAQVDVSGRNQAAAP